MRQNKKKDGFTNRPIRLGFVLPAIHERPTGGNLYNRKLIEALEEEADVRIIVWKDAWSSLPDSLADQLAASDGVVFDSLLLDKVSGLKNCRLGRHPVWFMLVHYLALCDPANIDQERKDLERKLLDQFDGFITTSHFARQKIEEAGIVPELVTCVYPGLADIYFADPKLPIQDDCCRLLTVSSLLPGKGIAELIEVLETLGDLAWEWTLVGDASLDPVYADFIHKKMALSSMRDRMRWRGVIDAAEMADCYRNHDLMILASTFETLSMATREALACGRPVIAFDVGGIKENMPKGGGVLVAPGDIEALGREMRRLIENAPMRALLGKQAMCNRKVYLDWSRTGQQFFHAIRL